MIKINRLSGYGDLARKYKVMLDDKQIGEIKDGESKCFQVEEGEHTLYLKIDWCKSNKVNFNASKDEEVEFECGGSMRGWKLFLGLIYITFLKNKYLWIKEKVS
ncbi:hypothetical protein SDC9_80528 [bioreactor metagenome]|uniref:DUF2846 domain-containing protein n=1 Tax=bioreactor metagenome TaxID=1076179 RepID=A0A644YZZ7_9ZZZZ